MQRRVAVLADGEQKRHGIGFRGAFFARAFAEVLCALMRWEYVSGGSVAIESYEGAPSLRMLLFVLVSRICKVTSEARHITSIDDGTPFWLKCFDAFQAQRFIQFRSSGSGSCSG
jgi:hypothetical protein